MNSRVNYVLVGIFVLALGVALIAGVLWLGVGGPRRENYEDYLVYMTESVSGLSVDSAVKYRGVDVGRVREISIDPSDPERVRLLLEVRRGTPIKEDTVAVLEMQGLTGIANVNLTGGSRDSPPLQARAGEEYPVIRSQPSLLGRLDQQLSKLMENITVTSQRVNALLGEDNRAAIKQTLAHLELLAGTLAKESQHLAAGLEDFAGTMRNAREATARLPALVAELDRGASALERAAGSTLPETDALLADLRQAADNLRRLSQDLARDPSILIYGAPRPVPGPGEQERQ